MRCGSEFRALVNGNIVGQPILGAITSGEQAKKLDALIDEAIANSGR